MPTNFIRLLSYAKNLGDSMVLHGNWVYENFLEYIIKKESNKKPFDRRRKTRRGENDRLVIFCTSYIP